MKLRIGKKVGKVGIGKKNKTKNMQKHAYIYKQTIDLIGRSFVIYILYGLDKNTYILEIPDQHCNIASLRTV